MRLWAVQRYDLKGAMIKPLGRLMEEKSCLLSGLFTYRYQRVLQKVSSAGIPLIEVPLSFFPGILGGELAR